MKKTVLALMAVLLSLTFIAACPPPPIVPHPRPGHLPRPPHP